MKMTKNKLKQNEKNFAMATNENYSDCYETEDELKKYRMLL